MTTNKPVSAFDRITAERGAEAYYLTDDLVIDAPTFAEAEKFQSIALESLDDGMLAWLGDEKFARYKAVLAVTQVNVVPYLLADLFGHFFGEEVARKLIAASEKAMSEALSAIK